MKALTLIQPWALLIMDGRKTVETRSWETKYHGLLAIHAGASADIMSCLRFGYDPKTIIRGAVLGTVRLVRCVQFPSPLVKIDEYGDFTSGRFGWILADVKPFKEPIKAKGMLGLWNWEDKNIVNASLF